MTGLADERTTRTSARQVAPAQAGTAGRAFRGDLEGLRGVAVLAVVLFHAGVPGMSGGYVGVDVFFVLSGFLITRLLRDELLRDGRVHLLRFWARRARRLLPAALLVLATTALAAVLLLSPLRARTVLGDALAAALYAGNHRFAVASTDYLADTDAVSPVLHFWSLGVEEQFYLLWPLLLLLAAGPWRRGRPAAVTLLPAVLLVMAVSFALCVRLTAVSQPWAFFSLPTRAWELATGGAVAVLAPQLHRTAAALLGWAGLVALAVAVVGLDATTAFPGTAALLPVLGTAALVAAGTGPAVRGPTTVLARALLRRAGRLSYSWYLWHWPVLVLAEEVAGPLGLPARLALVAASALLAAATLVLLEDPVRRSASLARRPGLVLAGALTATATVAAALVLAPAALPTAQGAVAAAPVPTAVPTPAPVPTASAAPTQDPFEAAVRRALVAGTAVREVPRNLRPSLEDAHDDQALPFSDGCHVRFLEVDLPPCEYGRTGAPARVVLLGDSHATHWFPALHAAAQARGWGLVAHGKNTCPPFGLPLQQPDLHRPYRECDAWQSAVLDKVARERPDVVVVGVARHYGPEWGISVQDRAWLQGMGSTVARLRATGAQVLVLSPTPWPRRDVPECLAEHLDDAAACSFSRAAAVSAAGARAERAVVESAGGSYVDVSDWLCAPQVCPVVVGDVLVYRDDNHITTTWTRTVSPLMAQRVAAALADARDSVDGVGDMDRALRDPRRPSRLLPAYDPGDLVHPDRD